MDMANNLNAGEKQHLPNLRVRIIDGKVKLRVAKVQVGENKYDTNMTLCGIRQSWLPIRYWNEIRKEYPESMCKKCEKKLKQLINEAR
jgi:predicted SprT family Zn-dependent metalloprotease